MARDQRRVQVNFDGRTPQQNAPQLRDNGRGVRVPDLQVTASPVDTFVRPVNTLDHSAGQKTAQLAQALSGLAPELMQYAGQMAAKNNAKHTEEGANAAAEAALQGKSYKDAVEAGLIPPHTNPFFVASFNEQYGRVSADKMADDVNQTLSVALKDETDPTKIDAAVHTAQEEWIKGNIGDDKDRHFSTGFAFRAAQHMEQVRSGLAAKVGANMEQFGDANTRAEAVGAIKDSIGKGIPVEEIAQDLNYLRGDLVRAGRSERNVDRALQEAIGSAILDNHDANLVSLFDSVKGTGGLSIRDALGDKGADFARGVVVQSNNAWRQKILQDRQDREYGQQQLKDSVAADAFKALQQNPAVDLSSYAATLAAGGVDPSEVLRMRNTVDKLAHYDDETVVDAQFNDVWSGKATVSSVLNQFNRGGITRETAYSLVGEIRTRDSIARGNRSQDRAEAQADAREAKEAHSQYLSLLRDPALTQGLSGVAGQMASPGGQIFGETATRIARVKAELTKAWATWQSTDAGAIASPQDKIEWVNNNTQALIATFGKTIPGTEGLKANLPAMGGVKTARPTISATDVQAFQTTHRLTPAAIQAATAAGITDPSKVAAWIAQQAALLNRK